RGEVDQFVSRAHQEASAYDLSLIEAAEAQPLAGGCPSVDTLAAHACDAVRLKEAVHGLALRSPEFSASSGLWRWQATVLASLAIVVCAGALLAAEPTFVALLVLLAIPFLFVVALRAVALWHFYNPPDLRRAADAARLEDEDLPIYTVLVPLFCEAAIVPDLICGLRAIEYPEHKLQVLLIVESIDRETQAALRGTVLGRHMHVLVMPDGKLRTNPRACQYALQFTTSAHVVVYDAEDWPDPAQLRRALAVFRATPKRLGCLQAQLNICNSNTSWLTRQFTIEYTALFDCILPTLERLKLPVPLGGTSNHFPRAVLDALGG
ncbi:MAG: glycosyltransferase, partial [Hyphomicrobium sp.]